MTTYKVTTYNVTKGYTVAIERIYYIDAKNEIHAKNKIKYILRKKNTIAIIKDIKVA